MAATPSIAAGPSTYVVAAIVALVAWRIYRRFKRAAGRQRLSRVRGPLTLLLYGFLIAVLALVNLRHPLHLAAFVAALGVGGALAHYALRRTTFEPTPTGLYYTPYAPIGIAVALLFVARLAWRAVEVYMIGGQVPRDATEFARSPLTLVAFGVMAGYYAAYMAGLVRWRWGVMRAKKAREAAAASSEAPPPVS